MDMLRVIRNGGSLLVFPEGNRAYAEFDKFTIQIALVAVALLISFLIMFFFAKLTDWTGVELFNSVAWGFNFIWGVIAANLIKLVIKGLEKTKLMKRQW